MIGRVAVAAAIAASACGRIAFDPVGDGAGTQTCEQRWESVTIAFGAPQRIAELATSSNRANPSLAAADTQLYFDDDSSGNEVLWMASRADTSSPWQGAAVVSALAAAGDTGRISVDASNAFAVLSQYRGSANENLWYTTRLSPGGPFGAPDQTEVTAPDQVSPNVLDPELRDGGLHLYFATGGNDQNIELAMRDITSAAFGTAREVALQGASSIGDPVLTPDELVIVFSSGATAPQNDLYYATRPDISANFGPAVPVPGVDEAGANDGDGELSQDTCDLYFRSDRGGHDQLYVAHAQ